MHEVIGVKIIFFFKVVSQIYMKDAERAETDENLISRYLRFSVFEV